MKPYGICDCGKWADAPQGFKENKHFLKCPCGKTMFLSHMHPNEAGYRDSAKVEATIINQ